LTEQGSQVASEVFRSILTLRSLPSVFIRGSIFLALVASLAAGEVKISGQPGPYLVKQWKQDWPGCAYEDGLENGRVEVVTTHDVPALRVRYPRSSYGAEAGGAGWRYPFPGVSQDNLSAQMSYQVRFEPGFEFVKGGKLPGLCGGKKTITGGDAVNGKEGWSARVMWRKDGRGQAYVYHMNQPSKYGDEFDFPEDFRFVIGVPYEITISVTMNTVGEKNGKLEVAVKEGAEGSSKVLVNKQDMEWRAEDSVGVDSILFNTFHGGSGDSWAPKTDCFATFWAFRWSVL
jgi:hypothetical protein